MIDIYIGEVTNRALKHRSMASRFRNPNNRRFRALVSKSTLQGGRLFGGFRQTEDYDDVPAVHHFGDRGSKDGVATTPGFSGPGCHESILLNPCLTITNTLWDSFERKFFTKA